MIKEARRERSPEAFRRAIKEARLSLGLSQMGAANLIDVSPNTIFKWENGYIRPRLFNVLAVADAYGIRRHVLIELLYEGSESVPT
jgi:DNA-binding XRE family transcriptional regulator